MRSKLVEARPKGRAYVVVMETGDDAVAELQHFFIAEEILSAEVTGIGGFARATLGYYDMDEKRYLSIEIEDQVEVVSLIGNVTAYNDAARLHAHCTVGHRDGRTSGGHLLAGTVRPTLELTVHELPARIVRTDRPEVGIPLIDLQLG